MFVIHVYDGCFQEETDERVVELQNMVQGVTHTEAEIQQMCSLLQDLESSMSNTKQRLEEVQCQSSCSLLYLYTHRPDVQSGTPGRKLCNVCLIFSFLFLKLLLTAYELFFFLYTALLQYILFNLISDIFIISMETVSSCIHT